jgi:sulfite oxidase
VEVKGYALPSGADGPIVKVDVSTDGGETWAPAEIVQYEQEEGVELKWAWCLWTAKVKLEKGKERAIHSRATDASGNTQPKCTAWNFRGVGYNGYGEAFGLEVV